MNRVCRSIRRSSWLGVLLFCVVVARAGTGTNAFQLGKVAYEQQNFPLAAQLFGEAVTNQPAAGTFQNLGNAEWQNGRPAEAIIAWERAVSLNPWASEAENNLKFAREKAQLEAPELTWCEIAAGWLPANWWAGLAGGSFWFAVAMMLVPGVLRRRKSATQQALVALGLGIFLLTLPANYGVVTRARIGFVLEAETPLRLTPTAEAEAVTKLAAGEPGRMVRGRGNYVLIQTRRASGWVAREKFVLTCPE